MRRLRTWTRTWMVAAFGLGGLLLVVAASMLALSRKAQAIYAEVDHLNTRHSIVDAKLRRLRSDVNLSGIYVRDYLLDVASENAPEYREHLAELRRTNLATLAELRPVSGVNAEQVAKLQTTLDDYWQTFDPLFDWTFAQKIFRSARFLRREVVPRRDAVLAIASQIEALNNSNLADQRAEVNRRYEAFRADARRLLLQSLFVGIVVALIAVFRLRIVERRAEEQRTIAEDAERQLRTLSQRLVAAQEEERKHLSRELHDHVAQVLTGLKMELGRIDRIGARDERRSAAVTECRRLVNDMFRTVRDLALGLRPSMLDDFGLQAGLEWHVRDFRRRSGLDVQLTIDGSLDHLSEAQRTCVYRAVQEALTNCARHASAHTVRVTVAAADDTLRLVVADDGCGFDRSVRREGLGLRGLEERVKELGGSMSIATSPGKGVTLAIQLPVAAARAADEVRLACAAR